MSENISIKNQRRFLAEWSILNFLGWIFGIYFAILVQSNLEYDNEYSAWETMLIWLPVGASIGIFQWFKLRKLKINLYAWTFITALGFSALFALYYWILNFDSFDYREYNIPAWVINTGLAFTLPIGGAIIGGLQSFSIRKHILRPSLWIRAYILGLFLPAIIAPVIILAKSFFLNILYISDLLYFFVDMRWLLFIGSLIIITVITTSILTGNILLKQSNINSSTIKAG